MPFISSKFLLLRDGDMLLTTAAFSASGLLGTLSYIRLPSVTSKRGFNIKADRAHNISLFKFLLLTTSSVRLLTRDLYSISGVRSETANVATISVVWGEHVAALL